MKSIDFNTNQAPVTTPASRCDGAAEEQPIPEQHETATTVVGNVLTVTQLLLRRGLILLVFFLIFVAGIFASHFLVKLLK